VQHKDFMMALCIFQYEIQSIGNRFSNGFIYNAWALDGIGLCYNNMAGNFAREMVGLVSQRLYPRTTGMEDLTMVARASSRSISSVGSSDVEDDASQESNPVRAPLFGHISTKSLHFDDVFRAEFSLKSRGNAKEKIKDLKERLKIAKLREKARTCETDCWDKLCAKKNQETAADLENELHETKIKELELRQGCAQDKFYLGYVAMLKAIEIGKDALKNLENEFLKLTEPLVDKYCKDSKHDLSYSIDVSELDDDDHKRLYHKAQKVRRRLEPSYMYMAIRWKNFAYLCLIWRFGQAQSLIGPLDHLPEEMRTHAENLRIHGKNNQDGKDNLILLETPFLLPLEYSNAIWGENHVDHLNLCDTAYSLVVGTVNLPGAMHAFVRFNNFIEDINNGIFKGCAQSKQLQGEILLAMGAPKAGSKFFHEAEKNMIEEWEDITDFNMEQMSYKGARLGSTQSGIVGLEILDKLDEDEESHDGLKAARKRVVCLSAYAAQLERQAADNGAKCEASLNEAIRRLHKFKASMDKSTFDPSTTSDDNIQDVIVALWVVACATREELKVFDAICQIIKLEIEIEKPSTSNQKQGKEKPSAAYEHQLMEHKMSTCKQLLQLSQEMMPGVKDVRYATWDQAIQANMRVNKMVANTKAWISAQDDEDETSKLRECVDMRHMLLLQKDAMYKVYVISDFLALSCSDEWNEEAADNMANLQTSAAIKFLTSFSYPIMPLYSVPKTCQFLVDVSSSMSDYKVSMAVDIIEKLIRKSRSFNINDDIGLLVVHDGEIKPIVDPIMPKHAVDIRTQLNKINKWTGKGQRRVFDVLARSYRDMFFRRHIMDKGEHKEQFIVLLTDYKAKSADKDGDGRISKDEEDDLETQTLLAVDSGLAVDESRTYKESELLAELLQSASDGHTSVHSHVNLVVIDIHDEDNEDDEARQNAQKARQGSVFQHWEELYPKLVRYCDMHTAVDLISKELFLESTSSNDVLRDIYMERNQTTTSTEMPLE